jgi:hypothetical protein
MQVFALLAALIALFAPAAFAYRPFDSTDAAVAANGEVEVELGPVGYERFPQQDVLIAPALIVNWGIADFWEVVLEAKQFHVVDADVTGPRYRLGDAGAFVKTVLHPGSLQGRGGPSVASEVGVLLPSINGEPGAGASALLIVSQRWAALALHANGSLLWTRAHEPGFFTGLIVEGPDAWRVRPAFEVVLEGERGARTVASVLAGGIWRVTQELAVDAAVRLAREAAGHVAEIRLGLTWAFAVGSPR